MNMNWAETENNLRSKPKSEVKYAWVIEHGLSTAGSPLYFNGFENVAGVKLARWVSNHQKAVRFQREIDARLVLPGLALDDEIVHRICEHGWDY